MAFAVQSSLGQVERNFAQVERDLNECGYRPIVSTFTGAFRALVGVVQTVAFGVLAIVSALSGSSALSQRYACIASNGLANIFRGLVEMIPIAGNLLCISYDQSGSAFQYIGERTDPESLLIRFASNIEIANGRAPQHSCFFNPEQPQCRTGHYRDF